MNTTASRGLVAIVAAPIAAAGICANVLAVSAVAHASTVIPGVNAHASGMTLSPEYISEQKEEHGASAKPIDLQMQQQASQPTAPPSRRPTNSRATSRAERSKRSR